MYVLVYHTYVRNVSIIYIKKGIFILEILLLCAENSDMQDGQLPKL